MNFTDLRSYITFLEEKNRLKTIHNADWDLEIGGLTEIAVQNQLPFALLFDDIEGYPKGFRILTNAVTTAFQWTAASGFEPTDNKQEAVIMRKNSSGVSKEELIPPKRVSTGPILENVDRDDQIDVSKFPAPRWHEYDGGRYIGTGDLVITKSPETRRVNVGTYRVQLQEPDKLTAYISPGKDGRLNRDAYLDTDEPCPIAISVGHPVDLFLAANERLSTTIPELDYAGGRRGESVEVVEGESTGLPIPAHSEIVFEGHIYPDSEPFSEGPFGEWTGYYAGGVHNEYPVDVERVYYRNDPIIFGKPPLRPPSQIRGELRVAARLWAELEESGIPGITAVNSMPFGPGWFEVISISQQYAGHSAQVGQHAASGPADAYHGRFTIIVDDDIDIFDQDEVMWAICSRCDPATDIYILENCWSTSLDPTISPEKREKDDLTNSRAIIDATRPYHWRDKFPRVNEISDELRDELHKKWGDKLFDR